MSMPETPPASTPDNPEEELRQEVDRFYEIARASVSVVWPSVKALAEAVLVHEEVDRDGLDEALGDGDIYSPVFAVQQAHGLLTASAVASPFQPRSS
jgi:hypothetical protein